MTKVMYEIPGMKDVVRCTVTEDTVLKGEPPRLERKRNEIVIKYNINAFCRKTGRILFE